MPKCLDVTMNVTAESKSQPPSGCDEPPGKVDQFLNDGLDPSALGRVTNDPFAGYQAELTDKPEDIVHQGGTGHDKLVGGQLTRRESLQVHAGLDPGVILFTKTMAPVQGNDLFVLDAQACPPPLKFDLGKKQLLSLLVNGALRTRMTRRKASSFSLPFSPVALCRSRTLKIATRFPGRGVSTVPLEKA
jgi:hypothetical protein